MGHQSIVHGRILLNRNFEDSINFIKSIGEDECYPQISAEMFGGLNVNEPTYWNHLLITFGSTYKEVEYYWDSFILKFETILRNVGFETAKIQLETELIGTYNFFWESKDGNSTGNENSSLIETEDWLFGYGNRCIHGTLETKLTQHDIFDFGRFKYPVSFTKAQKDAYNSMIISIELIENKKLYPYKTDIKFRNTYDLLFPILNLLRFEKKIDFGFDSETISSKGFYIIIYNNSDLTELEG